METTRSEDSSSSAGRTTGPESRPSRLRFRFVHILYALTLLATALATFGPGGLYGGLLVLAFWTIVFASRSRPQALALGCLVLLFGICLIGLLLPSVSSARTASRRAHCLNNLKQISLALHLYYDDYGSFPPPFLVDAQGRPMHSWRVLILPYLEQQALYDIYRFDEPWDGPNNRLLLARRPPVYGCPEHAPNPRNDANTSYLAVVDPRAAWEDRVAGQGGAAGQGGTSGGGRTGRLFVDFPDGTSNTILLVEGNLDVPWTAPQDASLEEAVELLATERGANRAPHRYEDFFHVHGLQRSAALVDGSVRSLFLPLDPGLAWALLQRNDGPLPPEDQWQVNFRPRLKVANCLRLAAFVALTLLPLPWVWLGQRQRRKTGA
ncbi:MAG: DUF1559 domain-containing protein [Pirellulaceae bacterium]|nr:DUF1559 domain-containing protein [Pirellulaceae bacterium]